MHSNSNSNCNNFSSCSSYISFSKRNKLRSPSNLRRKAFSAIFSARSGSPWVVPSVASSATPD